MSDTVNCPPAVALMSAAAASASLRHDAEVIGLVGLAHGTSHFFHLMLPPLFPWLMREFALSYTEAGLLMTVFFTVSGVGQALAGFVVDRIGARPVLFFGIATLAISGLVLGVSNSYTMLLVTAAVAGLGNSIFHPADFTLLNHRVATRAWVTRFQCTGCRAISAGPSAPVFMAGIASAADWHVAGFAASAVGFTVLAVLWLRRHVLADAARELVTRPANTPPCRARRWSARLSALRCGVAVLRLLLLTTAAFGILQNYSPAILGHVYGVSL